MERNLKTTVILLFFLLYSHDTLPHGKPSAGAACTLKSRQEKESHFLSMINVVSSKLMTNFQKKKRANEMQQRNLVVLWLQCVVDSNNEKQSWRLVMKTENECARGKAPVVEAALVESSEAVRFITLYSCQKYTNVN